MKTDLTDTLRQKVQEINNRDNTYATGRVQKFNQYIVEATGLLDVKYFERVLVGKNSEGYVTSIEEDGVNIALTNIGDAIHIGDVITATGEEFKASYSTEYVGHIIDMFGEDKLVGRKLDGLVQIPVEGKQIPIIDRITVNRPLLTGITGIDLLYPIGKGQRQLIIGDKKTGKTQITLDTIYNQRGKDVYCIYIAIGKTKKEIKDVYAELLKRSAMEYTTILAAFNDDPAPVLKITPYAGLSMAEKMLEEGKDVLVVIDDLKRHADVCREISLLMNGTVGRDAYPPDIFYSHSRMLELGCQHKNGGSITILPICETKAGDITDYISTNIISITDGQIVLSEKNFEKGQKPAINYGLSVSRLGGAVQTKEMKKAGPPLRRELLSYLEQKEIFELANLDEMSEELRLTMRRGALILSMLKQPKFGNKTPEEMLNMASNIK